MCVEKCNKKIDEQDEFDNYRAEIKRFYLRHV